MVGNRLSYGKVGAGQWFCPADNDSDLLDCAGGVARDDLLVNGRTLGCFKAGGSVTPLE